jgi:drug/metabolite transporter (DMT)-like permease
MAGSPFVLYGFMGLMLAMGTLNMLMLKFQHMQLAPMSPGGKPEHFDHPWLQAGLMMVGELLCLIAYFATRSPEDAEQFKKTPKWIFIVPCCCDLVATALLCMGLAFIAVSVAQMCRGTVIIFVCLMSYVFLRRRQKPQQMTGVALVMFGVVLVAIAAMQQQAAKTGSLVSTGSNLVTGICLCVFAQVFQASMFVYEEKVMREHTLVPLQVLGMEGLFGIFIATVILAVLQPLGHANTPGALHQIKSSPVLMLSIFGSMVAVALFNFAGATVTQKSSAVARTTIKISSTITIWMCELAFGWNTFSLLQLGGFIFVASGTVIYNNIVVLPFFDNEEMSPLAAKKGLDLGQLEEGATAKKA